MLNGNRMKSGRQRSPRDLYETPYQLVEAAIDKIHSDEEIAYYSGGIDVLDAGCGNGVWAKESVQFTYAGDFENDYPFITGIDIEPHITERPDLIDEIIVGDFLKFGPNYKFNIVLGNPPYSLAEEFVRHAYDLVYEEGYVYFLMRLAFLEGIKRGQGLFKDLPLKRVSICSRRPSFFSSKNGKHTTDTLAYAMFLWQKGYEGNPEIDWLDWSYK